MAQVIELTTAAGPVWIDPDHVGAVLYETAPATTTVYVLGLAFVVTEAASDVIALLNWGKVEGPTRTHKVHVSGPGR